MVKMQCGVFILAIPALFENSLSHEEQRTLKEVEKKQHDIHRKYLKNKISLKGNRNRFIRWMFAPVCTTGVENEENENP